MRTLLSLVNLAGGILVMLLGFAAFLELAHDPAVAAAGVIAMVLAAVCLWLAREFACGEPTPMA